jgi:alginate O-acetyltransferase complex protein AlgI
MLFNSYIFLFLFLPATLLGWWSLRSPRARLAFITLASYVFYGWWNWHFLPLMIASTTVDYIAGDRIAASDNSKTRRLWLVGSLTFNLGILGFFKYCNFFIDTVNKGSHDFHASWHLNALNIILPIGISFYTFNSMSYTIDIYRRIVRPAQSPLHFSAFVALFPHLIAGPIVRYSDIEDQLAKLKIRLTNQQAATGIFFFVAGMTKKVLIADRFAKNADMLFLAPSGAGVLAAWAGVLSYTFQIYFDFSAYSDMAVGLAHLLGIQFPQNFNSPYKAVDIADFWRRWHISLSTWLRDYLFIPLGGSRGSDLETIRNLTITMFLGGLWHGADWTFVVWGLYHGVLLAGHASLRRRGWTLHSRFLSRFATLFLVVIGWVFFRANSFTAAAQVLRGMFGWNGVLFDHQYLGSYVRLAAASAIVFLLPNTWEIKLKPQLRYAYAMAVVMIATILMLGNASPFLYFQF